MKSIIISQVICLKPLGIHLQTLGKGLQPLGNKLRTIGKGLQSLGDDLRALGDDLRTLGDDLRSSKGITWLSNTRKLNSVNYTFIIGNAVNLKK